jgi:hypothetical protein
VHFMWVSAQQQPEFASAMLPPGVELPGAVLLAPRKLRFSRHQGPFTQEALSQFMNKLASAQIATSALSDMPRLNEAEADMHADSADSTEEKEEEEFDLADVMGTTVEAGDMSREQELQAVRSQPQ